MAALLVGKIKTLQDFTGQLFNQWLYWLMRTMKKEQGGGYERRIIQFLPHGPVLSMTLNYINGMLESTRGGWDEWISDRENRSLSLADPSMIRTPEKDLLALSETDLEVLSEIWEKFGHMGAWELRDYTHDHLPEWTDPKGSSRPITYRNLFDALGFPKEKTEALINRIEEQRQINEAFTQ